MSRHREGGMLRMYLPALLLATVVVVTSGAANWSPEFITEPSSKNFTLLYGGPLQIDITLQCQLSNLTSGLTVSWFRNGDNISKNDTILADASPKYIVTAIPEANVYNLTILSVDYSNAVNATGEYICAVLNPNDTLLATSSPAIVQVGVIFQEGYPRCIIDGQEKQNYDVIINDRVALACFIPNVPYDDFGWFASNGSRLTTVVNLTNNTLKSTFIWYPMFANYSYFTCAVRLPGFEENIECRTGIFTVHVLPHVYPESFTLTSASRAVNFTCNASVYPNLSGFTWFIDGVETNGSYPVYEFGVELDSNVISLEILDLNDTSGVETLTKTYLITCVVAYGDRLVNASSTLTVDMLLTVSMLRPKFDAADTNVTTVSSTQERSSKTLSLAITGTSTMATSEQPAVTTVPTIPFLMTKVTREVSTAERSKTHSSAKTENITTTTTSEQPVITTGSTIPLGTTIVTTEVSTAESSKPHSSAKTKTITTASQQPVVKTESTTPFVMTTPLETTSTPMCTLTSESPGETEGKSVLGAALGVTLSLIILATVIGIVVYILMKRRRKKPKVSLEREKSRNIVFNARFESVDIEMYPPVRNPSKSFPRTVNLNKGETSLGTLDETATNVDVTASPPNGVSEGITTDPAVGGHSQKRDTEANIQELSDSSKQDSRTEKGEGNENTLSADIHVFGSTEDTRSTPKSSGVQKVEKADVLKVTDL